MQEELREISFLDGGDEVMELVPPEGVFVQKDECARIKAEGVDCGMVYFKDGAFYFLHPVTRQPLLIEEGLPIEIGAERKHSPARQYQDGVVVAESADNEFLFDGKYHGNSTSWRQVIVEGQGVARSHCRISLEGSGAEEVLVENVAAGGSTSISVQQNSGAIPELEGVSIDDEYTLCKIMSLDRQNKAHFIVVVQGRPHVSLGVVYFDHASGCWMHKAEGGHRQVGRSFMVGRSGSGYRADGETVSRNHIEFCSRGGDSLLIVPQETTNPTYVCIKKAGEEFTPQFRRRDRHDRLEDALTGTRQELGLHEGV